MQHAHEVEVHTATLVGGGCLITTRPRSVSYKKTATQTYLLRHQSRKTLYLDGGRLLGAQTDWRIMCTHYPFNFGSGAAVDRKLVAFRGCAERIQLRGLAHGGGRWKRKIVEATVAREERSGREQRLRVNSAQAAEVRSQRTWCGGEGDCARKHAG